MHCVVFDSTVKTRGAFSPGYFMAYAGPSKHSECFLDWLVVRFIPGGLLYKPHPQGCEIDKDSAKEILNLARFWDLNIWIKRYPDNRIKRLQVYSEKAEAYTAAGKYTIMDFQ